MARWFETIELADIFEDHESTFEQRRDAIVNRISESGWFQIYEEDYRETGTRHRLITYVEALAHSQHVREFDAIWGAVYDVADNDRIWISTF